MANGNLVDWFREKFLGTPPYVPQPTYRPPVVVRPPVPISVPPSPPSAIAAEPVAASLVGNHLGSKGRVADTGSLISGR